MDRWLCYEDLLEGTRLVSEDDLLCLGISEREYSMLAFSEGNTLCFNRGLDFLKMLEFGYIWMVVIGAGVS